MTIDSEKLQTAIQSHIAFVRNQQSPSNDDIRILFSDPAISVSALADKIMIYYQNNIVCIIQIARQAVCFNALYLDSELMSQLFSVVLVAVGLTQIKTRVSSYRTAPNKQEPCVMFYHELHGDLGLDIITLNFGLGHYLAYDWRFESMAVLANSFNGEAYD